MAINNQWEPNEEILAALKSKRKHSEMFDYERKLRLEKHRFNTIEPPNRPSFKQWRQDIHATLVEMEDLIRVGEIQTKDLSDKQKEILRIFHNPKIPIAQKKTSFQMIINDCLKPGLVKVGADKTQSIKARALAKLNPVLAKLTLEEREALGI